MSNNQEQSTGRVNPTNEGPKNPSAFFLQWKSKPKAFAYYDKEKQKDVSMPMPLTFIPVYRCFSIRGYNHKKNKTYISNEIKDLNTDVLVVKSYNNVTKENKIEYKGLYSEIKPDLDQNCKFTISLYAGIKNKKGDMVLVNLQINGAGLHHWFDFAQKNDIWAGGVKVAKTTVETTGDVNYNAPVYEMTAISKEDDTAAGKLQKMITDYLNGYFARNQSGTAESSKPSHNDPKTARQEVKEEEPDFESTSGASDDDSLPF